jgi:hypothetical protein
LYGVSVTHYVVLEFDRSLGGDCPANVPWLEHVLPVNPDAKWFEIFTVEQHEKMKHRLANLLPLSSEMNRSLSNKPYLDKRSRFKEDSMFKSTRQFADGVPEWTPQELVARSDSLANWALSRWPHERPGSRVRETL